MIQVMPLNESWQSDKLRQRLDEVQRKMEKGFEQSSLYSELLKSKNGDPALPPSWYKTLSKVKTGVLDILAVIGNIGQINDAQIIINDLRPWRTSEYTDEDGMDVQCQIAGSLEITNDVLDAEEFFALLPKEKRKFDQILKRFTSDSNVNFKEKIQFELFAEAPGRYNKYTFGISIILHPPVHDTSILFNIEIGCTFFTPENYR